MASTLSVQLYSYLRLLCNNNRPPHRRRRANARSHQRLFGFTLVKHFFSSRHIIRRQYSKYNVEPSHGKTNAERLTECWGKASKMMVVEYSFVPIIALDRRFKCETWDIRQRPIQRGRASKVWIRRSPIDSGIFDVGNGWLLCQDDFRLELLQTPPGHKTQLQATVPMCFEVRKS